MKNSFLKKLVSIFAKKKETGSPEKSTPEFSFVDSGMLKSIVVGNSRGVTNAEEAYWNDSDYGLVPEKPIYVNGFGGIRTYLAMLRTDKGEPVTYARKGSRNIEGIEGIVDIYEISKKKNGRFYGTLFICLYGAVTSNHAPKGYSLQ